MNSVWAQIWTDTCWIGLRFLCATHEWDGQSRQRTRWSVVSPPRLTFRVSPMSTAVLHHTNPIFPTHFRFALLCAPRPGSASVNIWAMAPSLHAGLCWNESSHCQPSEPVGSPGPPSSRPPRTKMTHSLSHRSNHMSHVSCES